MDSVSKLRAAVVAKQYCLVKLERAQEELTGAISAMTMAEERCDAATDAYGDADLACIEADRALKQLVAESGLQWSDVSELTNDEGDHPLASVAA